MNSCVCVSLKCWWWYIILFLCLFSLWSQSRTPVSIATSWMTSPTGSKVFPWCQLIWVWSPWCARASWPFSCCPQTPAQVGLSFSAQSWSFSFSITDLPSYSSVCILFSPSVINTVVIFYPFEAPHVTSPLFTIRRLWEIVFELCVFQVSL